VSDHSVTPGAWTRAEFEQRLRERGRAYHVHHPFNLMLNGGQATRAQIRGWVANRFYYQISIPLKDAAILANCEERAVRRNWVQRILDHDGYGDDPGGIESWLRLAEAVGLERSQVESLQDVLPGSRECAPRSPSSSRPRSTGSVWLPGPGTTRGSTRRA